MPRSTGPFFHNRAMTILHIHKYFDYRDGAALYLQRLMTKQAEAGHQAHVLSTRHPTNKPTPDAKYFTHYYDFSRSEGPKKDAIKALQFLWNTEAKQATERAIRELKPDVIHLHNIYHHFSTSILSAIRASGVPCVQTLHDLKLACPNYKMFTEGSACERCKGGKYWNPILHHCLSSSFLGNTLAAVEMTFSKITQAYEKTVQTFICPSAFYAQKMREWGEPASHFSVVPNPAEGSARAAHGGGGFILYAGRLSAEKGVDILIRASARVPGLPLRIAGAGPEEEKLHHLARTLGARHVSFLGFVPSSELVSLRAVAEAVVIPSVWYENGPLTALEAMGDGVPVIASQIAGLVELVDDGTEGLLATPGSVDAWTVALERFLTLSQDERRRMGERGRERIRTTHSWDAHLRNLEKIYTQAQKERSPADH